MKFEKELIEIYGLILGDGYFGIEKGKYIRMEFYNYNLKLVEHIQKLIKIVSNKTAKIRQRKKKTGIEYSIHLPSEVSKPIVKLGYNKERVPSWILKSKFSIMLLKSLFEAEGSVNSSQIVIYQSYHSQLLEDCVKIANKHNLSAHVHRCGKNRSNNEFYLAIENCRKIKKLFGELVKKLHSKESVKGAHYITKRKILLLLNRGSFTADEIAEFLKLEGIRMTKSYRGYAMLNNHLKPLSEFGIITRRKPKYIRDKLGRIYPQPSKWKVSRKLSKEFILNYPYV